VFARSPILRAAILPLPLLIGLACNDDDAGGPTGDPAPDGTFLVQASMDAQFEHISVWNDGAPIGNATVAVNGEAAASGAAGEYSVTLAAPVAPGGSLTLEVKVGGETIIATGNVPEAPAVTAPADAAVIPSTDAIDVTWTSTADPDWFRVFAMRASEFGGYSSGSVASTERAFSIPPHMVPAGDWVIGVVAYDGGDFTGPIESGSVMYIRGAAAAYSSVTIVGGEPPLIRGIIR
jgi:hypothetical protein